MNTRERFRALRASLSPFEGGILLLMVAWALAIISLPLLKWLLGENALPLGISVGVLLQLMTVWAILIWTWGAPRAWRIALMVVACAWLFEYVGRTTGFPFGSYRYTDRLQPQIGGVPLLIPLAWLTMLPPAWAVASRIASRFGRKRWVFIAVSALAVVVWDLFLDPQMVGWNSLDVDAAQRIVGRLFRHSLGQFRRMGAGVGADHGAGERHRAVARTACSPADRPLRHHLGARNDRAALLLGLAGSRAGRRRGDGQCAPLERQKRFVYSDGYIVQTLAEPICRTIPAHQGARFKNGYNLPNSL